MIKDPNMKFSKRIVSFAGILGAVLLSRFFPSSPLLWGLISVSVLFFWSVHAMRFSITNLRTILILVAGFGVALFAFQDYLPFSRLQATSGAFMNLELSPGSVASLYQSHEKALELYFDHFPSADERYFKTGFYNDTLNGLSYEKNTGHQIQADLAPETNRWARENLKNLSIAEVASQVQSIWKKDFRYSLTPGQMKGPHPLDTFLFERKTGFCEHYAAALTSIFKLLQFEARIAVGFSGGQFNPFLRTLTYEMADAHAWVEVYDAHSNRWMRLDPTRWIDPELNPQKQVAFFKPIGFFLLPMLALFFSWILFTNKKNPVLNFLSIIGKLEKKKSLSGLGLTLSERVERLKPLYPENINALSEALQAYHHAFYAMPPISEGISFLNRKLAQIK